MIFQLKRIRLMDWPPMLVPFLKASDAKAGTQARIATRQFRITTTRSITAAIIHHRFFILSIPLQNRI
jgi:hypothetical protein